MKPRDTFPLLLCAAILAGGYGGHRIRRSSVPVMENPNVITISTGTLATPPNNSRKAAPEAPPQLVRWLESAAKLAGDAHADLAMDSPHLFLALAGWNSRELTEAMAEAQRLPDGPVRKRLEEWILKQWTERSPVAAMAWTREHRPDQYPGAVEALARRDAAAAWQAVLEYPQLIDREGDTASFIFSQWALQDRLAALDALLKMRREKNNDWLHADDGLAERALPPRAKDPEAWAAARDALTQRVMQEKDFKIRYGGIDLLKNALERQLTDSPPAERREELTTWLRSLQLDEKEFAAQVTMVAQHDGCAPEQAREAWPWLWNTVPESQRGPTLKSIVEYWASDKAWSAKDPNACGQWLNTQMPLGPEHGAALRDFALHAAATDPVSGLAWAAENPDPAIRPTAIQEVQALIRKQWPHRLAELSIPEQ